VRLLRRASRVCQRRPDVADRTESEHV
jgi:hypothetical protein